MAITAMGISSTHFPKVGLGNNKQFCSIACAKHSIQIILDYFEIFHLSFLSSAMSLGLYIHDLKEITLLIEFVVPVL